MDENQFLFRITQHIKVTIWKRLLKYFWKHLKLSCDKQQYMILSFCYFLRKRKNLFLCVWLKIKAIQTESKFLYSVPEANSTVNQNLKCSNLNKTQTLMSPFTFLQRQKTGEGQGLQQWASMRKVVEKEYQELTVIK